MYNKGNETTKRNKIGGNMTLEKQVIPIKDCAVILGVVYRTLHRHVVSGAIPSVKVGNRWFMTKEQIDKVLCK